MKQQRDFVLASGSPRRSSYFEQLGFKFRIKIPNIVEKSVPGESPLEHATRLAVDKGLAIIDECEADELIFSADTIVSIAGEILGKPTDAKDIFRMLELLSGQTHEVITSYMIFDQLDNKKIVRNSISKVIFKKLSPQLIKWYRNQGESTDKAGAYSIQGKGGLLVESIQGSFNNIVGLPIEMIFSDLIENNWISL